MGSNERAVSGRETPPAEVMRSTERAGGLRLDLRHLGWLQAVVATGGSLYFSEVMKFTPCVLCWYQRICMYPLVVIFTVGILLRERRLNLYVLPLSLIGLGIAIYHTLLYYGVIAEALVPCTGGVPCNARFINWFGFVSIPLLSLIAFTVITIAMLLHVPAAPDGGQAVE